MPAFPFQCFAGDVSDSVLSDGEYGSRMLSDKLASDALLVAGASLVDSSPSPLCDVTNFGWVRGEGTLLLAMWAHLRPHQTQQRREGGTINGCFNGLWFGAVLEVHAPSCCSCHCFRLVILLRVCLVPGLVKLEDGVSTEVQIM